MPPLTSIAVVGLFRNNAVYLEELKGIIERMEHYFKNRFQFSYYFFENDSHDSTKQRLRQLIQGRTGEAYCETIPKLPMMKGIKMQRGVKMAGLRNTLKMRHGPLKTDYVLIIDSDVFFHPFAVAQMVDAIKRLGAAMITPYGICWLGFQRSKMKNLHYYDSFAFITKKGISYQHTQNTCLFANCSTCGIFRRRKRLPLNHHLLNPNADEIEVNSAFGGMALLQTKFYNKCRWGASICEHFSFCESVRHMGGRIFCIPNIKVVVNSDGYINRKNHGLIKAFLSKIYKNSMLLKPLPPSPKQDPSPKPEPKPEQESKSTAPSPKPRISLRFKPKSTPASAPTPAPTPAPTVSDSLKKEFGELIDDTLDTFLPANMTTDDILKLISESQPG